MTRHIDKYINANKFEKNLIKILKNLVNIPQDIIFKELRDLVKRDIIDETTKDSVKGYVYVV